MRSIWAVTRQTFIECVRTRIFAAFMILLGACVVTLALTAEGDGSLKGRIQTFLAYSISATQVLLAMVTIFMATGIVAGDVRRKTIFTVASKPLRRWQYVLGRWLGIVALNAVLLAATLGMVYGLAQYLRGQPTRTEKDLAAGQRPTRTVDMDRVGVESGIFTASVNTVGAALRIGQPTLVFERQGISGGTVGDDWQYSIVVKPEGEPEVAPLALVVNWIAELERP